MKEKTEKWPEHKTTEGMNRFLQSGNPQASRAQCSPIISNRLIMYNASHAPKRGHQVV